MIFHTTIGMASDNRKSNEPNIDMEVHRDRAGMFGGLATTRFALLGNFLYFVASTLLFPHFKP